MEKFSEALTFYSFPEFFSVVLFGIPYRFFSSWNFFEILVLQLFGIFLYKFFEISYNYFFL